jgi:signal recognition particle receptor subunit alpha
MFLYLLDIQSIILPCPILHSYGVTVLWQSQAEEIAEKLCESVAASLEGKKLASFTRISSTVQVC